MKTALITGATAGIGQATTRLLVENGWRVIGTGRRQERLDSLKEELGADQPADRDALESTLTVVLLALGQSLIGGPLSSALKLPSHTARDIAERFVVDSLEKVQGTAT